MDENQFAYYFFILHQKQIKQDLQIKYIDTDITVQTIADFIRKNNMLQKFKKCQDLIHNKKIYSKIIYGLQTAIQQNISLKITADEYIKHLENKLYKHSYIE